MLHKIFYHNQVGKPNSQWQGLHGGSVVLSIAELAKQQERVLVVIAKDAEMCVHLENELRFFLSNENNLAILTFPDWETLPYDHFSPHQDIISDRILTLYKLPSLKHGIVLIAANTLFQRLAPVDYIVANSFVLRLAEDLDVELLKTRLVKHGYYNVEKVMEHGEFAVRGSIIDIFPMGSNQPFRIDLFDKQIDSIRYFDPDTQRSLQKVSAINLLPAKEFPLDEDTIVYFRRVWRETFSGVTHSNPIYQNISNGESVGGIEYYLPLFFEKMADIFEYLPKSSICINFADFRDVGKEFWQEVNERYEQLRHDRERPLLPPAQLFLTGDEVLEKLQNFSVLTIVAENAVNPSREECVGTSLKPVATLAQAHEPCEQACNNSKNLSAKIIFKVEKLPDISIDNKLTYPLAKIKDFLNAISARVLLCAESLGRREVLLDLLKTIDIRPSLFETWGEFLQSQDKMGITVAQIETGFILQEDRIVLITEGDLFGKKMIMQRRLRSPRERQDVAALVRDLNELQIGAPVVHLEYGIAKYLGLQILRVGEIDGEYLTLEYANQAKLYVPVASMHLISRYTGVDQENVAYSELGSKQWDKAKRKAIEKIRDVAAELLDLYAKREASKGYAFKVPALEYQKFAAAFPFEETPDQQKAIEEVLADMKNPRNMDRLICGDVGFGKTEVAMRAAFVAVFNQKQVSLLVPTTILAQQHYNNFRDRFAELPVNIALLSRFCTAREQKIVLDQLAEGKVDIVIGTHKLLQPGIKFKNLGLLVIDEEHRFGVRQKEQIKALRPNVDVLTLTATPIPRTLNMAFAGIRDFSIIASPPMKRLSIKTFLHDRDKSLIREAILREILRGGQVYFLHNNVTTIEKTAQELQELVPNIRPAVAHGQMLERQLEKIMSDFYHLRYNVLVCTTIIESGIDVPTANTIIIDRADRFGLAQLHQLRGRVGRSHHQAYAYLLVPSKKALTRDAARRLEVITAMEDLGAGFNLASHDLEIRGAGELLGEDQSGQIEGIGFSLYMEYLERAVKLLKQNPEIDLPSVLDTEKTITEIDLKISALIPDTYLHDINMRLVFYKRIADAKTSEQLDALQTEMIDRFGLLPEPAKNLFAVTLLRLHAEKLGIRKIAAGVSGGSVEFAAKPKVNPAKIIELIQKYPTQYKLRGSNKIEFFANFVKAGDKIDFISKLLDVLNVC